MLIRLLRRADLDALKQIQRHAEIVRERSLDHIAVADQRYSASA